MKKRKSIHSHETKACIPSPFAIETFWNTTFAKFSSIIWVGVRSSTTNTASMDAQQFFPSHAELVDTDSQNADKFEMRVYPNPSTGKINVELSSELVGEFELFNSSGQVIQKGTVTKSFELYIPIAGEYFIRILFEQGVFYKRITIVK